MEQHEGHEFYIFQTDDLTMPSRLLVSCDQFDELVPVPLPI